MMKTQPDRRIVLKLVAASAVAAVAWPAAAGSMDMDGTVTFEGGATIPEGSLEIALEDAAITDQATRRLSLTRIQSDGTATSLPFILPLPATLGSSPSLELVARLERGNGWLLARGSARFDANAPVEVTLTTVTY